MEINTFTETLERLRIQGDHLKNELDQHEGAEDLSSLDRQLTIEALLVAEEKVRVQQEELALLQAALEAERRQYQELLEFAPDCYLVTDSRGIIQEANYAAAALLGPEPRYLVGKPLVVFVAAAWQREFRRFLLHIRPETVQIQETLLRPRKHPEEVPVVMFVGAMCDVTGEIQALRWMIRDISQNKQIYAQMEKTNQMLTMLIEAAPLAIVALDPTGYVRVWNRAAEVLFGTEANKVIGYPVPTLIIEDQEKQISWWERVLQGDSVYEAPAMGWHLDRSPVMVRISAAPLRDSSGQITGIMGILVDMTGQRQLARDLQQAKRQLDEGREAERQHMARELHDDAIQDLLGLNYHLARSRKVVSAAHEPWTEAVRHGVAADLRLAETEILQIISRLRDLLRNLRPPGLTEFGLTATLEGYLAALRRSLDGGKPRIVVELDSIGTELPYHIAVCVFRTAQEALQNAVKHAQASQVLLALQKRPGGVVLQVSDDGQGFVVPQRWSDLAQSNHFGLVGMRERAELVEGQLSITSEKGAGTTLRLSIALDSDRDS